MVGRQLRALDRRFGETLKLHAVLSKEDERSQRRRLPRSPGSIARRSIISCALAISCPEVNDANGTDSLKDAGRQLGRP